MAIYKKGQHTTAKEFTEACAATNDMKIKTLDDGSVWARIHWLDVMTDTTMYADAAAVADSGAANRFSKMEKIDNFGGSMVTLTNLAPQINGATGFSAGSAISTEGYYKYNSSALLLTGTTSGAEITSTATQTVPLIAGHTYYVRVEIKQSTKQGSCDIFLGGTTVGGSVTAEGATVSSVAASANAVWTIASAVKTLHSSIATGGHKIRVDYNNSKTAGTMAFDGLMVIDLTEAFGPSFTPTKAWCDANISYFTGTINLNASSSGFKRWEFMLTYPRYSTTLYNRWSQTGSPNESAPGGYIRITTPWTAHAGPIRKNNAGSAIYNCDNVGTTTWYAAIGQTSIWNDGIPCAIDGNPQKETELWVRIDNLSPAQKAKIYDGNHLAGGQLYEF